MAERAEKMLVRKVAPPTPVDVASWQAQMRQAMFESLDTEAVRQIVGSLVEKAKKGDMAAARLVLSYAIGSPTVQVRNAVIVSDQAAPLPTPPSRAVPGSTLRMTDLATRAERGLPLHDPRDAGFGAAD